MKKTVNDTLNSLEGIQRATPSPFFFTRVQAAMENSNRNTWNLLISLIARPTVAVGGLLLVMLLNGLALWQHEKPAAPLAEQSRQALADEYNLATTTVYDYENSEAR